MIAEPVTVLTDYVLAAVAAVLGLRLCREPASARRLWGFGLLATAFAAAVGGSEHGLRPRLGPEARWWMWEATYLAIGAANALLLAGLVRGTVPPRAQRFALALVALRFLAFAVVATVDHAFRHVVVDYALTLVLLAVAAGWAARRGWPWSRPLAAGVAVSCAGALVQHGGFALHTHFNHNDLFHVLQTWGVVLYARAGARLDDRA